MESEILLHLQLKHKNRRIKILLVESKNSEPTRFFKITIKRLINLKKREIAVSKFTVSPGSLYLLNDQLNFLFSNPEVIAFIGDDIRNTFKEPEKDKVKLKGNFKCFKNEN